MKILIVEDEFLIAMTLEKELKKEGHQIVAIVSSGEKAVETVRNQIPDIILMDIGLAEKIDGIEAARQIRQMSSVPIVFMTGYSNIDTRKRAEIVSPLAYLIKPVSVKNLKSIFDANDLLL